MQNCIFVSQLQYFCCCITSFLNASWIFFLSILVYIGNQMEFSCKYFKRNLSMTEKLIKVYHWKLTWTCREKSRETPFLEVKASNGIHQVNLYWKFTWPPFIHTSALKKVTLAVQVHTVGFVKCFDIAVFQLILNQSGQ